MDELVIYAPVNQLGYGVVGTNLTVALKEELPNTKVSLICKNGRPNLERSQWPHGLEECMQNGQTASHKAPSLNIWHLHDMAQFAGKPRIGYPIFEMPALSPPEIVACNNLDEVWLPSKWAENIIKLHSDTKTHVVPCGVDTITFCPEGTQGPFTDDQYFTFLNVGKLEKRKGHYLIAEAMNMIALCSDKKVRLLAYWSNPFIPDVGKSIGELLGSAGFTCADEDKSQLVARFRHNSNPENCVIDIILCGGMDNNQMAELYRSANVGLYPYFAEGWNLPLLETMSCGVPCIATNYSAPTEYLADDNHIQLSTGKQVIANDGVFFHGNKGTWFVPKLTELTDKMMSAIDGSVDLKAIAEKGRETALKFTWKNAAQCAVSALESSGNL